MSKKTVIIICLAVLVLVIVFIGIGKKKGWIGGDVGTKVSTEKVESRDITERVIASGKIYAVTDVKISPDVSGEVVDLTVQEGDSVNVGDLLLRIKPDLYQSSVDQAEASLNNTKAQELNMKAQLTQQENQYSIAKSKYDRNKKLYDQKVISDADFEQVSTDLKNAESQLTAFKQSLEAAGYSVQSSNASLKQAKENLFKTTIYAPMSGIVSKLNTHKGERVLGTVQMQGTEVMTISNLYDMEARVDVSENDVLRVHIGDSAEIELDAYPNTKFKGVVYQIAYSASGNALTSTTTEQATNFTVKIKLLRETTVKKLFEEKHIRFPFRPGMSAGVSIITSRVHNVLSVPLQAATTREDSTSKSEKKKKTIVFLINGGKAKEMVVTTGIQDQDHIEILSGLKAGDEVIAAPYNAISKDLKNGDAVKVVPKDKLFSK